MGLRELQLPPISSGDQLAAGRAATMALHFVWLVIGHRVVNCQFLVGGDVPHRDKDNLALQSSLRRAAVVDVPHAARAFG